MYARENELLNKSFAWLKITRKHERSLLKLPGLIFWISPEQHSRRTIDLLCMQSIGFITEIKALYYLFALLM